MPDRAKNEPEAAPRQPLTPLNAVPVPPGAEQARVLERNLFGQAWRLPCFEAADNLSGLLGDALNACAFADTRDLKLETWNEATPRMLIGSAITYLGYIAFRAARSALHLVAVGYERQAMAMTRNLLETEVFLLIVKGDPTGQQARLWLDGKLSMPQSERRLRSLYSTSELAKSALAVYRMYSRMGPHALLSSVNASTDPETGEVLFVFAPSRHAETSNSILANAAGGAWLMTYALCEHNGRTLTVPSEWLQPVYEAWGKGSEFAEMVRNLGDGSLGPKL